MAIEIDLKIYGDPTETRHLGSIRLYFGKSLVSKWAGWDWVEENGMSVDSPSILDDKFSKRGTIIARETLLKWIHDGYLSPDPSGNSTTGSFLETIPQNAVFRLSFLDWS